MPHAPVTASDHLQPVLRVLRRTLRYWWAGLAVLALGAGATAAAARFRPQQFRSEAVLYYREGMQWGTNDPVSSRRVGQRLKDLLLARTQLVKIIEEMNLHPRLMAAGRVPEAVEEMQQATTFKVSEGDIFVVGFTGTSPEEAQRVTARLTDLLIGENSRLRSGQAEVAKDFLEAERKRSESELAAKEAEYVRFLAAHPEFLEDANARGGVGASLRARNAPPASDADLIALRNEEQRLRRQVASVTGAAGGPQEGDLAAARDEAEAKLRTAQRELADRRARFTEEHPDVRSAAAAVAQAQAAYQRASEAVKRSAAPGQASEAELQLAEVRRQIAARQRRQPPPPPVETAPGGGPTAGRVVALETEWARLSREVADARERIQQLDNRQFVASMTLNTVASGQAAQIVVIDPAYLPAKPVGMSTTRLLILGLAMSLVGGIGVAMALGTLDDRLYERDEVDRLGLVPVLVEIPALAQGRKARKERAARATVHPPPNLARTEGQRTAGAAPSPSAGEAGSAPGAATSTDLVPVSRVAPGSPAGTGEAMVLGERGGAAPGEPSVLVRSVRVDAHPADDPRLIMLGDPTSRVAAGFRVLRHRITERRSSAALLVTSPSPGEGRTFCAANLALALGEAWQARVLLLEANLRGPALARLIGFTPPICIARQLETFRNTGAHYWEVAQTIVPWLHTAAVDAEGASADDLDGPSISACVVDLRRAGYDFVVMDGPPVLGSADANLLEQCADGVLLVLRAGRSRAREFRNTVEQLGEDRILGVVWLAS
jgi:Mrp family chromosome partitioning ATPase/uncharacterized protein involved in exopolysaccharide biosynthesis